MGNFSCVRLLLPLLTLSLTSAGMRKGLKTFSYEWGDSEQKDTSVISKNVVSDYYEKC